MAPTILQEKALKPETLPKISSVLSIALLISILVLSIIYGIDWFTPILSTQVVAEPDRCYPIRFKCAGCTDNIGCTLVGHGPNTIQSNKELGLSTNNFTYILPGSIVTLNICAGSSESIHISFNSSTKSPDLFGYCQVNLTEINLVGYLETSPNNWSPLSTYYDENYHTHIIDYAMWRTTLFSNGTTLRYQDNSMTLAPLYYCFPSNGLSPFMYVCSAIRMSMISWSVEETRLGFLTLVGIIGGMIGILYRLAYWFLLFLRKIQTRFFSETDSSVTTKPSIQTEFV